MNELKQALEQNGVELSLPSMGGQSVAATSSCTWGCSEGACTTGGCRIRHFLQNIA